MNERIEKLAEQAGSTHKQNLGVYQFYSDELEKFAELIVRECIETMYNTEQITVAQFVDTTLKQHFGVEE